MTEMGRNTTDADAARLRKEWGHWPPPGYLDGSDVTPRPFSVSAVQDVISRHCLDMEPHVTPRGLAQAIFDAFTRPTGNKE